MTPQYSSYKPVPTGWLDSVPSHWAVSRFGLEMAVNSGLVDPLDERWADLILVAPNHVEANTGRILGAETAAQQGADSGKFTVSAGQIIYSKIRPALNKVAIATEDCLCSADMYGLTSLRGDDHRYLAYFMRSAPFHAFASEVSSRVKMPKINQDELSAAVWIRPPRDEQRQIADFLDRETARIDTLIDKQQQLIETLRERRIAAVGSVLMRGLDPTVPMKNTGLASIGEIPARWRVVPTRYLCTITTGTEDSGNATEDGEYPLYVRGREVLRIGHYSFDCEAVLTPGDGQGGTGKVFHYVNGRFEAHQRVYVFKDFKDIAGWYFYLFLSTFLRHVALAGSNTVTMESLRRPLLADFRVVVPPLADQQRISEYLDEQTARIDVLIAKAEEFIELSRERRSALITAAVTGQIDVREMSTEGAA